MTKPQIKTQWHYDAVQKGILDTTQSTTIKVYNDPTWAGLEKISPARKHSSTGHSLIEDMWIVELLQPLVLQSMIERCLFFQTWWNWMMDNDQYPNCLDCLPASFTEPCPTWSVITIGVHEADRLHKYCSLFIILTVTPHGCSREHQTQLALWDEIGTEIGKNWAPDLWAEVQQHSSVLLLWLSRGPLGQMSHFDG